MGRRGVRIAILLAAVPLGWGAVRAVRTWHAEAELRAAFAEIDRGHLGPARRRLSRLSAARPGALDGRVDYWLGICEALRGDPDAALEAFDRVPGSLRFDPKGAFLKARSALERGRLRDAESCLEAAMGGPGAPPSEIRDLLIRVYQVEVRFDDAGALLRDGLGSSEEPIASLKLLGDLGRGGLPVGGLEGGPRAGRSHGPRRRPRLARQGAAGDPDRRLGRGRRMAPTVPRRSPRRARLGGVARLFEGGRPPGRGDPRPGSPRGRRARPGRSARCPGMARRASGG